VTAQVAQSEMTSDTLLDGRVILRQPSVGYRVALDPVLLAAAVPDVQNARALDVGCGTGAAMLCAAMRLKTIDVTGLEIQPQHVALAEENIALNGLQTRARVMQGDIAALPDLVCTYQFDVIMTNPPFADGGTPSPNKPLAQAHHETHVPLNVWISACLKLLKPKGRLVMIHRADRLGEIMAALALACGDINIFPIFPKINEPARRVLINAGKDRKTGDTVHFGLTLHAADGSYTSAAQDVLRRMGAIMGKS
jgi:tRNA1(Val) A37 N6-methylase TrmN6